MQPDDFCGLFENCRNIDTQTCPSCVSGKLKHLNCFTNLQLFHQVQDTTPASFKSATCPASVKGPWFIWKPIFRVRGTARQEFKLTSASDLQGGSRGRGLDFVDMKSWVPSLYKFHFIKPQLFALLQHSTTTWTTLYVKQFSFHLLMVMLQGLNNDSGTLSYLLRWFARTSPGATTIRSALSTNSANYSRRARPPQRSSAPRDASAVGPVAKLKVNFKHCDTLWDTAVLAERDDNIHAWFPRNPIKILAIWHPFCSTAGLELWHNAIVRSHTPDSVLYQPLWSKKILPSLVPSPRDSHGHSGMIKYRINCSPQDNATKLFPTTTNARGWNRRTEYYARDFKLSFAVREKTFYSCRLCGFPAFNTNILLQSPLHCSLVSAGGITGSAACWNRPV